MSEINFSSGYWTHIQYIDAGILNIARMLTSNALQNLLADTVYYEVDHEALANL